MRVTTKAYTNNYLKNNATLVNNLLKSENRILTQRKYNRASEDSSSAAKAAHVRKSLENLDIYDENCKTAKSVFYAAEDALYDVADKTYLNVKQKICSIQDTFSQVELDIVAQELEELADHMIQDMNIDFSERQLFGSQSNNKTPFTVFSKVRVFDASGAEVALLGNPPDRAVQNGNDISIMFMDDNDFYDENGNIVDLASAQADTKLFRSDGTLYSVTADGNGGVKDINGQTVKAYPADQVFYDETGKPIDDFSEYSEAYLGEEGSTSNKKTVYYDSPNTNDPTTTAIHVVGVCDKSEQQTDNVVCYNDVPINLKGNDLLAAVQGGRIEYYNEEGKLEGCKVIDIPLKNGAVGNADAFPGANPIYVDIGLGIKYDENGTVNPSTALNVCMNGAEMTGCGTDKDGDSLNIIQLVYDAATAMRKGDRESVNRLIDKLDTAHTKVLNAITDLGIKQNNMDYYVDRNEINRLSLLDKQNDLEGCDLEEEITNWKTVEAAYNASLSMGSKVLPKSLFDFI